MNRKKEICDKCKHCLKLSDQYLCRKMELGVGFVVDKYTVLPECPYEFEHLVLSQKLEGADGGDKII